MTSRHNSRKTQEFTSGALAYISELTRYVKVCSAPINGTPYDHISSLTSDACTDARELVRTCAELQKLGIFSNKEIVRKCEQMKINLQQIKVMVCTQREQEAKRMFFETTAKIIQTCEEVRESLDNRIVMSQISTSIVSDAESSYDSDYLPDEDDDDENDWIDYDHDSQ